MAMAATAGLCCSYRPSGSRLAGAGKKLENLSRYVVRRNNGSIAVQAGGAVAAATGASKGEKKTAKGRDNKSLEESRGKDADSIWTSRAGWACVKSCGACCILDKGPDYPPIEEVLTDASEAALYRSMVGPDGWCINYDKPSRSCTIHDDRPRFCRVEPETLKDLYGIEEKDWAKEACGFCQDQIRSVYGGRSKELKTYQRVIRNLRKSEPSKDG